MAQNRKMNNPNSPFTAQIEMQREAIIEQTRNWIRGWEVDQREMVLWILEEEVQKDKLMNFEHEDGMLDTSTGDSSLSSWLESRAFGSQGWPQKSYTWDFQPVDLTWDHRNTYPAGTTTVTCSFTDLEPSDYSTDTWPINTAWKSNYSPAPSDRTVWGTDYFTVTVNSDVVDDTTPPVITLPSYLVNGVTLEATDASGILIGHPHELFNSIYEIGVTDNVGVAMLPTNIQWGKVGPADNKILCGAPPGSVYIFGSGLEGRFYQAAHPSYQPLPIGTTTIICTAVDTSGNRGHASFTVTVNPAGTTQRNILAVPADQVFTTTNSTGTYTYGFDVSSDGYPTTCEYDTDYLGSSYGTTTHSRPHMEHQMDHWFVFPEGTTQVKCEFSVGAWESRNDWSDGDWSDTASFTVTVNPDNTTPIETNIINISSFAVTSSCDDTKTCLDPYHAQVSLNQNVTWSATPFATVIVSGNPVSGPDGLFNFGFKTNEESVFMFNQPGTFQFFDMTHPWIAGNVTVTGGN